MNKKLESESVDALFEGILALRTREECYAFFEDICTANELVSLAQRFAVARMLFENMTYNQISEKTGASTATISRVNRSLTYGNDGYALVLKRLSDAAAAAAENEQPSDPEGVLVDPIPTDHRYV